MQKHTVLNEEMTEVSFVFGAPEWPFNLNIAHLMRIFTNLLFTKLKSFNLTFKSHEFTIFPTGHECSVTVNVRI